ncbi:hypothetical protein niasHT_015828 [Heterodera trifolii]|uniref:Uncharacterized protein n=1 Tax=Heterodera trifolii TaxID=157864 RepID=A0ABD2L4R8_9BILA
MEAKDAALVLVGRRRRGGREKQRVGPLTHCERARQCTSKEFPPPPHPLSRPSPAIILARESRKKLNDYELFEGSREMKPVEEKLSRVKTLAEQRSSGRRECWEGRGEKERRSDRLRGGERGGRGRGGGREGRGTVWPLHLSPSILRRPPAREKQRKDEGRSTLTMSMREGNL